MDIVTRRTSAATRVDICRVFEPARRTGYLQTSCRKLERSRIVSSFLQPASRIVQPSILPSYPSNFLELLGIRKLLPRTKLLLSLCICGLLSGDPLRPDMSLTISARFRLPRPSTGPF